MTKSLNDIGKEAWENAVNKGFRDGFKLRDHEKRVEQLEAIDPTTSIDPVLIKMQAKLARQTYENLIFKKLLLIITEVAELADAFEKGTYREQDPSKPGLNLSYLEEELSDIEIRLQDFAHYCQVDMDKSVEKKMEYNKTRPFKHNKKN